MKNYLGCKGSVNTSRSGVNVEVYDNEVLFVEGEDIGDTDNERLGAAFGIANSFVALGYAAWPNSLF